MEASNTTGHERQAKPLFFRVPASPAQLVGRGETLPCWGGGNSGGGEFHDQLHLVWSVNLKPISMPQPGSSNFEVNKQVPKQVPLTLVSLTNFTVNSSKSGMACSQKRKPHHEGYIWWLRILCVSSTEHLVKKTIENSGLD